MTGPLPPDLPDPEPPGPTIWAAREVCRDPVPAIGETLARAARLIGCVAVLLIVGLAAAVWGWP